jgi:putative solute:sodium symporter small subunit
MSQDLHGKPPHPDTRSPQAYWRANLRLVGICLAIWFLVSYGFGILLVDVLNRYSIFGFKLGFWFAQQGSIYVFLALIFYYARRMNRLDREYGVEEQD